MHWEEAKIDRIDFLPELFLFTHVKENKIDLK